MSGTLAFLFLALAVLLGSETEIGAAPQTPVLTGPALAYQGSRVQFTCEVTPWASPLTFELWKDTEGLIASGQGLSVTFELLVKEGSEGKYFCKEASGGGASDTIKLQTVVPVVGARLSSNPHPPVLFEGQSLVLQCLVRSGSRLSFTWFHEKQEVKAPSPQFRINGNTLSVDAVSEKHAGKYSCMAQNQVTLNPRFSSSTDLQITVKQHISDLSISFSISKEVAGLQANINCSVSRGSPPIRFSLLLEGKEVEVKSEDTLSAAFTLPLSLGVDLGLAQCGAQTESQRLVSDPVRVHVVPVGGTVRVMANYLYDDSATTVVAILLKCTAERGTFPIFSWIFNQSSLPLGGTVLYTTPALVLTDIRPGFYRCRVRDRFNDSSVWRESDDVFIQKTELAVAPLELVALVFCVFLSMVIIGGSVFLFWSVEHRFKASKHHHHQGVQTDAEIVNAQQVDPSSQPQTINIKVVTMEFEA
ncbi:hypothetical protein DNTS_032603 [Danionella cerebrum]|uniref:Ig-like domain-containing protein n=1 Tax=Danionella cerebrum TaxID=2873325 RepID=A0A553PYA1_9TELE|nr:hypothetical protein DNTS_032603 [Danionella translucida]TRY82675.1 hypothetical protein DNTS_032603 [Danionella translucida]